MPGQPLRLNPAAASYYPPPPDSKPPPPPGSSSSRPSPNIPQHDGADGDASTAVPLDRAEPTLEAVPAKAAPADGSDELGSDLDDDADATDEEQEVDDLLLCLYEKVNRTRNKWKTNFKAGIVQINGRDYAFSRLNGDFEW